MVRNAAGVVGVGLAHGLCKGEMARGEEEECDRDFDRKNLQLATASEGGRLPMGGRLHPLCRIAPKSSGLISSLVPLSSCTARPAESSPVHKCMFPRPDPPPVLAHGGRS